MQQQIDALSVDQLWSAVCLATKECPCNECHIHYTKQGQAMPVYDTAFHLGRECDNCAGKGPKPGLVWALPGMQEATGHHLCKKHGHCVYAATHGPNEDCHGSGYAAKRNLETLLTVLVTVGIKPSLKFVAQDSKWRNASWEAHMRWYVNGVGGETFAWDDSLPMPAILRAVEQVLVAQGAELGGQ